jgi:hypothetical protein
MIDAQRLAKFKRRAKSFVSQEHLDRAMFSFPIEHHEEIAAIIQPLLPVRYDLVNWQKLTARKVESMPQIEFKDGENPTLHESTVARLNTMATALQDQAAKIQDYEKMISELQAEIARLTK